VLQHFDEVEELLDANEENLAAQPAQPSSMDQATAGGLTLAHAVIAHGIGESELCEQATAGAERRPRRPDLRRAMVEDFAEA